MAASATGMSLTRDAWRDALKELVAAELEPMRRRATRRYHLYGSQVRLTYLPRDTSELALVRTGGMLNISVTGLMVKTFSAFPEGVDVGLDIVLGTRHFIGDGVVRHCSQTLGGFKVGVELKFV